MTHPLLTRFEQLNGRHVTLPELKNFLARVQGELDNHSHGPAASALENVRKRLANAIQKATPYFANAQPGDQFKVVLSGRKPVKHYTEELQKIMKDDKKFFLKAAAAAQKAADYITNNKFSAQQPEKVKQKKISEAKRDFDDIKSKLKDPDQFQREFDESGLNHYQFLQVVAFTGSWAQAQKTSVEKLVKPASAKRYLLNWKKRKKPGLKKAVCAWTRPWIIFTPPRTKPKNTHPKTKPCARQKTECGRLSINQSPSHHPSKT
jgi:hypothetical protein